MRLCPWCHEQMGGGEGKTSGQTEAKKAKTRKNKVQEGKKNISRNRLEHVWLRSWTWCQRCLIDSVASCGRSGSNVSSMVFLFSFPETVGPLFCPHKCFQNLTGFPKTYCFHCSKTQVLLKSLGHGRKKSRTCLSPHCTVNRLVAMAMVLLLWHHRNRWRW